VQAVLSGPFRWGSVSRLCFHTLTISKDVPCFSGGFVHSAPGGGSVSFAVSPGSGFVFFFSVLAFGVRVWVRVCAHAGRACRRACRGARRCIFLYKLELESGSVA